MELKEVAALKIAEATAMGTAAVIVILEAETAFSCQVSAFSAFNDRYRAPCM